MTPGQIAILVICLVLFIILLIFVCNIRIIKQTDKAIVERLGAYHAEKPSCGRLFIPRGAATCFLSQKDVLPPEWSVEETLGFYLSLPLKCSFSRSRFLDLLALFSLNSVLTLPAQSLGDGERHALALLFALATSADVYLLDEPFALLDDQRKKIALAQIEELSIHRVVVVVNHESDIHFAHSLASRIVFQGKRAQVSALSLLPLSPAAASRKKRISEPFALALKHHFHWSVSSLLRLLLLGCFLLSSGLAFASSVPSDEALDAFMKKYRLLSRYEAFQKVHCPTSLEDVHQGLRVLKYEEALLFSLKSQIVRGENRALLKDRRRVIDRAKLDHFISSMPYQLTSDQRKALEEGLDDMDSPHVMYRLLQGDVGTGKTLVAALLAYANHLRSEQTALMKPSSSSMRRRGKMASSKPRLSRKSRI